MGGAADIEAFARLLDGAPAGSVSSSVASLGHTVSALQAIPAPVLPSGLTGAGARVALFASPKTGSAHGAKAAGISSKLAGTKAGVMGVFTAHLMPVVAGTAVLAIGVTGVAVGASRSLPGDPLYGIKRVIESVQTQVATTRVGSAELRLTFATTRLHEAVALQTSGGSATHLAEALNDWLTEETAALKVLGPLARTPAVKAKLAAFASENSASLLALPAATVGASTAAVAQITALITTPPVKLPAHPPRVIATVVPQPTSAPSTAATSPATVGHVSSPAAHLPSALPSVTARLPTVPRAAKSAVPTASAVVLPSSAAPTLASPTPALPTPAGILPTTLQGIPVPIIPGGDAVLQGLLPKH